MDELSEPGGGGGMERFLNVQALAVVMGRPG